MFVREKMTTSVITLSTDAPFQDAFNLMKEHKIRRIPVVDAKRKLVGIVSERDLLHAAPSPATSLSIWEMNYLLWKLDLSNLMSKNVVTVTPNTLLQDAATLMIKNKIGGLPVVDDEFRVIGVITETDIFKAFVELLTTEQLVYA